MYLRRFFDLVTFDLHSKSFRILALFTLFMASSLLLLIIVASMRVTKPVPEKTASLQHDKLHTDAYSKTVDTAVLSSSGTVTGKIISLNLPTNMTIRGESNQSYTLTLSAQTLAAYKQASISDPYSKIDFTTLKAGDLIVGYGFLHKNNLTTVAILANMPVPTFITPSGPIPTLPKGTSFPAPPPISSTGGKPK
jgi:hypothetical protein